MNPLQWGGYLLLLRIFKESGSVPLSATHVIHGTRWRHEVDMAHRLHKERKVRLTTPMTVTYYNLRIDTSLCAVTFKFSSTSRRVGLEEDP